jgi:hypothetical protein
MRTSVLKTYSAGRNEHYYCVDIDKEARTIQWQDVCIREQKIKILQSLALPIAAIVKS